MLLSEAFCTTVRQKRSAITYDADPEREYEECMVKIEKLKRCLYQAPAEAGAKAQA